MRGKEMRGAPPKSGELDRGMCPRNLASPSRGVSCQSLVAFHNNRYSVQSPQGSRVRRETRAGGRWIRTLGPPSRPPGDDAAVMLGDFRIDELMAHHPDRGTSRCSTAE